MREVNMTFFEQFNNNCMLPKKNTITFLKYAFKIKYKDHKEQ